MKSNWVWVIDEGLRALKHFFDQCTVKEPTSETLLRLAELGMMADGIENFPF